MVMPEIVILAQTLPIQFRNPDVLSEMSTRLNFNGVNVSLAFLFEVRHDFVK